MRLLLAEDDLKLAGALDLGLRRAGYGVDVAHDGDTALLNARVYDYDAVVLDVMLPGADGFEVCRTMREEQRWSPVLLLTARDQVADRVRGLDAGADDYLVKPFHFAELLARLRALTRRGPTPRPPKLAVGDLEVDPATRRVSRAGEPVELTAREFGVLEYLASRPGEVVTRTELLEHVWDANHEGSTNVVDVYVGYLRTKLERPFGRALIRTVRGAGYRLEPE
ncbi:MAG: two-component system, OmpR family, response regulator [Thermoleophilaceae bacterium]|jgi:two-component system OmpR family response regulator|nr:two-component system, OmpR family, response regulator [Thermoleophilaceae bacterium]